MAASLLYAALGCLVACLVLLGVLARPSVHFQCMVSLAPSWLIAGWMALFVVSIAGLVLLAIGIGTPFGPSVALAIASVSSSASGLAVLCLNPLHGVPSLHLQSPLPTSSRAQAVLISFCLYQIASVVTGIASLLCLALLQFRPSVEDSFRYSGVWAFIIPNFFCVVLSAFFLNAHVNRSEDCQVELLASLCERACRYNVQVTETATNALPAAVSQCLKPPSKPAQNDVQVVSQALGVEALDLQAYLWSVHNRTLVLSVVMYVTSVAILLVMAIVYQEVTGKVTGFTMCVGIILCDSLILVDSASRLGPLAIVLLIIRTVFVSVPALYNFIAACVAYIFAATFLLWFLFFIRREGLALPLSLMLLSLYIIVFTIVVGVAALPTMTSSQSSPPSAPRTGPPSTPRFATVAPTSAPTNAHIQVLTSDIGYLTVGNVVVQQWIFGILALAVAGFELVTLMASRNGTLLAWFGAYLAAMILAVVIEVVVDMGLYLIVLSCACLYPAALLALYAWGSWQRADYSQDTTALRLAGLSNALLFAWYGLLVGLVPPGQRWLSATIAAEVQCAALVFVACLQWYHRGSTSRWLWVCIFGAIMLHALGLSAALAGYLQGLVSVQALNSNPWTGAFVIAWVLVPGGLVWLASAVALADASWSSDTWLIIAGICAELVMLGGVALTWVLFGVDAGVILSTCLLYVMSFSLIAFAWRVNTDFRSLPTLFLVSIAVIFLTFAMANTWLPKGLRCSLGWPVYMLCGLALLLLAVFARILSSVSMSEVIWIPSPTPWGLPLARYQVQHRGGELTASVGAVVSGLIALICLEIGGWVVLFVDDAVNVGAIVVGWSSGLVWALAWELAQVRYRRLRGFVARGEVRARAVSLALRRCREVAQLAIVRQSGKSTDDVAEENDRALTSWGIRVLFLLLFELYSKRLLRPSPPVSIEPTTSSLEKELMHSALSNEASTSSPEPSPGEKKKDGPEEEAYAFWVDPNFAHSQHSLYEDWDDDMEAIAQEDDIAAVWLRPRQLNSAAELIPQGHVDARDVVQGAVGDCWLLAALCVVAMRRELLERVLVDQQLSADGKLTLRLYNRRGVWEDIVIDDALPCDAVSREPLYAWSRSKQAVWMSMVEKAFAKRVGCYSKLHGGQVHSALVALTGGFAEVVSLAEDVEMVETDALFRKLLMHTARNDLMAVGSGKFEVQVAKDNGLVSGHAYAVTGVKMVVDWKGVHRLVQLQDPWGEYQGSWRDESEWTHRRRSLLSPCAPGVFWLPLDELVVHFAHLYVCRLFPKHWHSASVCGTWMDVAPFCLRVEGASTRRKQHALPFSSLRTAKVFAALTRSSGQGFISLLLLNQVDSDGVVRAKNVLGSTGTCRRTDHVSLEATLEIGASYFLLAKAYDGSGKVLKGDDAEGEFMLEVHCESVALTLTRL